MTWNCPAIASHRTNLRAPQNTVEERLFAQLVHEQPSAPPVRLVEFDIPVFIEKHGPQMASLQHWIVSTDGSEEGGVAAWSAVWPQLSETFSQGVCSEDQSPFRAEIDALLFVLHLLCILCNSTVLPVSKTVIIVSDCESALNVVAQKAPGQAPGLAAKASAFLQVLSNFGVRIDFCWVPSHGKPSSKFCAHPLCTKSQMRYWNELADDSARKCMKNRLRDSHRSLWNAARVVARQWELCAIRAAAAAAQVYAEHVATLR